MNEHGTKNHLGGHMIEPLLVNSAEAARLLGIGKSLFYEQISVGRIFSPIRINSKSLWSVEKLRQWVETETAKVKDK